jgi:hypothetical protein
MPPATKSWWPSELSSLGRGWPNMTYAYEMATAISAASQAYLWPSHSVKLQKDSGKVLTINTNLFWG